MIVHSLGHCKATPTELELFWKLMNATSVCKALDEEDSSGLQWMRKQLKHMNLLKWQREVLQHAKSLMLLLQVKSQLAPAPVMPWELELSQGLFTRGRSVGIILIKGCSRFFDWWIALLHYLHPFTQKSQVGPLAAPPQQTVPMWLQPTSQQKLCRRSKG